MTTLELHGIAYELKFWKGFVQTPRFLDGWVNHKIDTPELHLPVMQFVKSLYSLNASLSVLDIGSGVVSILNGTVPKENITTCDPLGEMYELIFDYKKYGIKPPLPIPAEEIDTVHQYSVVHCSNALDHTQNPLEAFNRMWAAVSTGGFIILQGFEEEANRENWRGFHQWNISLDEVNKMLVIDGKQGHLTSLCNPDFHW